MTKGACDSMYRMVKKGLSDKVTFSRDLKEIRQ